MNRIRICLTLLIGAVLIAAPVAANEAAADMAPAQTLEAARRAITSIDQTRLFGDRAYAAQIMEHLAVLETTAPQGNVLKALRLVRTATHLALGEGLKAAAVSEMLIGSDPTDPNVYSGAFLGYLSQGKSSEAASVVQRAAKSITAETGKAELRRTFPREAVLHLDRTLAAADKAGRAQLAEALVRIDWAGPSGLSTRDHLRSIAIDGLLDRGDQAGAAAIAKQVQDPSTLLRLLVARKYDGLFGAGMDPALRFEAALKSYDNATAEALALDPHSVDGLLGRIQYLRSVGRNSEILPMVQPLLSDMEAVGRTGDQALWIVNEVAYALLALGRGNEAVALMDRLLALGIDAHPTLVNMSINKAPIMSASGMHAEAFKHIQAIEKAQRQYASPYGKMWMASSAVCALAAQGKVAEAAPWLDRLKKQAAEAKNEAALSRALLCVQDFDGAERLLLKRLASAEPEQAIVATQIHRIKGGASSFDQRLADSWEEIIKRPSVQAAVAKVGRSLTLPTVRDYWGDF